MKHCDTTDRELKRTVVQKVNKSQENKQANKKTVQWAKKQIQQTEGEFCQRDWVWPQSQRVSSLQKDTTNSGTEELNKMKNTLESIGNTEDHMGIIITEQVDRRLDVPQIEEERGSKYCFLMKKLYKSYIF